MPAHREYPRVRRLLPLIAGCVLISGGFLLEIITETGLPQSLLLVLVLSGCSFVVLGIFLRHHRFSTALSNVSLAILSATISVAALEAIGRVVGFDFDRLHQPGDDVPIYYRTPMLHAGEGVFRRPGPASWRGRPLAAYMRMHGAGEGPYAGEQPVVVEYDRLGFRNPPDLTDWEVVVAGDSFVELGYLPYEQLFTTVAAQRLGIRIKNLGVAGTGPVSQTFYVKKYGKAKSTKDAVLCFFEGNDLNDLTRELRNTESFRALGQPWERRKQVSLVKEIGRHLKIDRRAATVAASRVTPNAVVMTGNQERPMTVGVNPPVWDRLGRNRQEAVVCAMSNWAATVRAQGMRPWVMCLPDSHRVFHGLLRYSNPDGGMARWRPGEFAPHLGQACTNLDIRFIDPFPALRRAVDAGRSPYNLVGDNHLSVEGSSIVAEVLVDAFRSKDAR